MKQSIMSLAGVGLVAFIVAFCLAVIPFYQARAQEPGALTAAEGLGESLSSGSDTAGATLSSTKSAAAKKKNKKKSKSLKGVDISSWQAGISINKVKADFIIIKATGGTGYTNPYFREWADATLASGKLLGFYHYAREASSPGTAVKEAAHFVKEVKPYIGKAVLALDFEGSALGQENCVRWAKKFLKVVQNRTGVKPLIYLSQSATHSYNWSSVARYYKLWVAQYLYKNFNTGYLKKPDGGTDLGFWSSAKMYQYSSTGRVKGYDGDLDLNKFYGGARAWKKLARKR